MPIEVKYDSVCVWKATMKKYRPDRAFDVDIWKDGESFGRLTVGFGINEDTGQLLLFFGNVVSNQVPAWWMVAERHIALLYFFLDHKIFFDGQLGKSGKHYRQRGGSWTYEIHYEPDSYQEFLKLLDAEVSQESGRPGAWVSSRKIYSLVRIISLTLDFMDCEMKMSVQEFEEQRGHFLDILEEEALHR